MGAFGVPSNDNDANNDSPRSRVRAAHRRPAAKSPPKQQRAASLPAAPPPGAAAAARRFIQSVRVLEPRPLPRVVDSSPSRRQSPSPPRRPSPSRLIQSSPHLPNSQDEYILAAKLEQLRIKHETMTALQNKALAETVSQMKQRSASLHSDIHSAIIQFEALERDAIQQRLAIERQQKEEAEAALRLKKEQEEATGRRIREAELAKQAAQAAEAERKKAEIEAAAAREQQLQKARDAAEQRRLADSHAASQQGQSKEAAPGQTQPQSKPDLSNPSSQQAVHIVSEDAWEFAGPCIENTMRIKNTVKLAVMSNPAFKSVLFKAKMTITQRTGQLTRSQSKIIEIARALNTNMLDAKNQSQELYEYIMDLTAKRIINQAETEVAVKRNMAFPLGIVCVLLFDKHEPFLKILLGRLMKKCPYIVPRYFRKLANESTPDYMKRIGFKESDDGTLESEIQYGERMCGILSLYAAILQTSNVPNRHGLSHAWSWLARILNIKPRYLTPLLLHTFLEVAGHAIISTYKRQATKLMRYIVEVAIPSMPPRANASTTRLKLFLEETVLKNGVIPKYEGSILEA